MSLEGFIIFARDRGAVIPDGILDDYLRDIYGDPPAEWTYDQRRCVRKAVVKTLDKNMERFHEKPNPDDIVDYLWRVGWEIREFRGVVYGHEEYLKRYLDHYHPHSRSPLDRSDQEDPYLVEVKKILSAFGLVPDERESRMIIRSGIPSNWIRYSCELFRSWGYDHDHFTIGNVLKQAHTKHTQKNEKYIFDI